MNKIFGFFKWLWSTMRVPVHSTDDDITIQDGGMNTTGFKNATTMTQDGELK
jgi:hypothetical protein